MWSSDMRMSLHTCCVTIKEDQRLWVIQNRVWRERELDLGETIGKKGRVDNEELHDLYCSPNVTADDQMKEDALGMALGMYERKDKLIQDFGQESCRKVAT